MSNLLFTGKDWSEGKINESWKHIEEIAKEELQLDYFEPQIEIINSDRMLDLYASIGMPIMYNHWSFGKHYLSQASSYKKGFSGLALELVINTDPLICYLMDENTMTQQVMVMAHAIAGHGSFFKNNVFFKQWTDPGHIIDYLDFAKKYIADCEERYGFEAVERVLDACHSLQDYGVDRYKKPKKLSLENETKRQKEREEYEQKAINVLWETIPTDENKIFRSKNNLFPKEPEENILYFIEKNAPKLEQWQREIVRIVRKISQYFYPQKQTKIANEGFATFTHQYIMRRLHEKELIDDGSYMEFLQCHSSVVYQPEFSSRHYSGYNPYALGSDILHDIKRICEEPTKEDEQWFPDLVGKNWLEEVKNAAYNYRDESLIQQFLSPTLMRKWKMFEIHDESTSVFIDIKNIHNETGFREIRKTLAKQNSLSFREPEILVYNVNLNGSRQLYLRHNRYNNVGLNSQLAKKVLTNLEFLWGYQVRIDSYESIQNFDGSWDDRIICTYDVLSSVSFPFISS
jgi:stage V sporulation protein R